MNRRFAPRPLLPGLILALALSSASAQTLEQLGSPASTLAGLQTSGADVPARNALKTLLPEGWRVLVHDSVRLPPALSWQAGQTWVQALEALAKSASISVLVDWDLQAVYFRSPVLASQEFGAGAPAAAAPVAAAPAAAAATSAPAAQPRPAALAAAALAERLRAEQAQAQVAGAAPSGAAVAVPRLVRQPQAQARQVSQLAALGTTPVGTTAGAVQPGAGASNEALGATPLPSVSGYVPSASTDMAGAMSFNQESVQTVLKHAARLHGYRLSLQGADVRFPGAVTLMGVDMGEDLRLMARALGRGSGVQLELYRNEQVVRMRAAAPAEPALAVSAVPFTGALTDFTAVASAGATATIAAAVATPAVPVAQPRAPAPIFTGPDTPGGPAPAPVVQQAYVAEAPGAATHAAAPAATPEASSSAAQTLPPYQAPSAVTRATSHDRTLKVMAPGTVGSVEPSSDVDPQGAPMTGKTVTLSIERGQSLRHALEDFLRAQDLRLKWELREDLEAGYPVSLQGDSVAAVLNSLMPRLGLSADIYTPSSLVVIRPGNEALDK